ncbi:hypothetical protein Srubr_48170 [Streptomyces rubradiris]|uniref:Uncharacterized protein n=1 Tax=Streptomyces rubradiris TaxID=285531 RepID=A0ABQ3RGJ0_STRRR|nr:hypothetical protein GCM10018792_57200 [Streptomyces rubradiris]GHI54971.1 hypothetical protein Srubr_48170 [Streptomyces rubradiris]
MQGWDLKEAKEMGVGQCHDVAGRDSCAQVRFFGVAAFRQENEPDISFIVQAYRDEDTARAACGYRRPGRCRPGASVISGMPWPGSAPRSSKGRRA